MKDWLSSKETKVFSPIYYAKFELIDYNMLSFNQIAGLFDYQFLSKEEPVNVLDFFWK